MSQYPSAPTTPTIPGFLPPVGLKCIVLKLVIPSEIIERVSYFVDLLLLEYTRYISV